MCVPPRASSALPTPGSHGSEDTYATVQMQWTVQMADHKVRLGSVVQLPSAPASVLHIPPELVQEDLRKLKPHISHLLQMDRPDKDPAQFRFHACLSLPYIRCHTTAQSYRFAMDFPILQVLCQKYLSLCAGTLTGTPWPAHHR